MPWGEVNEVKPMETAKMTAEVPGRTRAQEQTAINILYINAQIGRDEWRKRTDELSDLLMWCAKGRLPDVEKNKRSC